MYDKCSTFWRVGVVSALKDVTDVKKWDIISRSYDDIKQPLFLLCALWVESWAWSQHQWWISVLTVLWLIPNYEKAGLIYILYIYLLAVRKCFCIIKMEINNQRKFNSAIRFLNVRITVRLIFYSRTASFLTKLETLTFTPRVEPSTYMKFKSHKWIDWIRWKHLWQYKDKWVCKNKRHSIKNIHYNIGFITITRDVRIQSVSVPYSL